MAETQPYKHPSKMPLEELKQGIRDAYIEHEALKKAGKPIPRDEALQLKRAERILGQRERELHGAGRTLNIVGQAPARGILGTAGIPGDIRDISTTLANAPQVPWLGGPISPQSPSYFPPGTYGQEPAGINPLEHLPTNEMIQEAITEAPTLLGLDPLMRPETKGQEYLDVGLQSLFGTVVPMAGTKMPSMMGVKPPRTAFGQPEWRIPMLSPDEATIRAQGPGKTLGRELMASAGSAAASQAAHDVGEATKLGAWALPLELAAGLTGGQLASHTQGVINELRRAPGWTTEEWRVMHRVGQHVQSLLAGGTPPEIAWKYVMDTLQRENKPEILRRLTRAAYLQSLGNLEDTRVIPPEYKPTLGGVTESPGILHLEETQYPGAQTRLRQLETEQKPAGQEALYERIYEAENLPRPAEGTITQAVEQGNLPVPTEDVAGALQPRLRQEQSALEQVQATGQEAFETQKGRVETETAEAKLQAARARRPRREDAIRQHLERKRALQGEFATQQVEAETAMRGRIESRTERLQAQTERAIAKAEEREARLAQGLESPRGERADVERATSHEIRELTFQEWENFQHEARGQYGGLQADAVYGKHPEYVQSLEDTRTQAEADNRQDRFPSREVQDFEDSVRATIKQATPAGQDPRAVTDIRQEDITAPQLMAFRSKLLAWERQHGPSTYSRQLISETQDAMTKLAKDSNRPDLMREFEKVSAWYKEKVTPFTTPLGADILERTSEGWPATINYTNPETGKVEQRQYKFRVPNSNLASKILDGPSGEGIEAFVQVTGGKTQAKAALEEALAHRLYVKYGSKGTDAELLQYYHDNKPLFLAMNQAGMGSVERKFQNLTETRGRLRELESELKSQARKDRIQRITDQEKERLDSQTRRINEEKFLNLSDNDAIKRNMQDQLNEEKLISNQNIEKRRAKEIEMVNEKMTLFTNDMNERSKALLARYFVPDVPQGNQVPAMAAHLEKVFAADSNRQLTINVKEMVDRVRGDKAAELAVRRATVAELWRRAKGDATAFKAEINRHEHTLAAAGVNRKGKVVLREYADLLENQTRQFDPNAAPNIFAELEGTQLFMGKTILHTLVQAFGLSGGIAGALQGGRIGYDTGPRGVSKSGAGVQTGRSIGGLTGRTLAKLIGKDASEAYNMSVVQALENLVYDPDFQKIADDFVKYDGRPQDKAKLRAYLVSLGLPTRSEDNDDKPAPAPAALTAMPPEPAPKPLPTP